MGVPSLGVPSGVPSGRPACYCNRTARLLGSSASQPGTFGLRGTVSRGEGIQSRPHSVNNCFCERFDFFYPIIVRMLTVQAAPHLSFWHAFASASACFAHCFFTRARALVASLHVVLFSLPFAHAASLAFVLHDRQTVGTRP